MRILLALAMVIGTASAALADTAPVLVIPGRPGVPIIINGVDASYAVIEADWGLAKGEHFTPVIYGGRYLDSTPNVGHYYPSAGYQPGYGRLEIEPPANRRLPQPAEGYHESWSAQSAPQPVQPEVPMYPPQVIVAPPAGDAGIPQDFSAPPRDFRHRKLPNVPR